VEKSFSYVKGRATQEKKRLLAVEGIPNPREGRCEKRVVLRKVRILQETDRATTFEEKAPGGEMSAWNSGGKKHPGGATFANLA